MIEEKYIEATVASMSLIGVGRERPCYWGNYFWFSDGSRCLNMWAENLKSARVRFLNDGMVKVRQYTCEEGKQKDYKWSIVIDDRIPDEGWFYNKLCTTGSWPQTGNPMVVITDNEVKAAKHGFDKWSFRRHKEDAKKNMRK